MLPASQHLTEMIIAAPDAAVPLVFALTRI